MKYLERFPNTPSLTLAKKMYIENKELFKTIEETNRIIRYYRGLSGNKDRKKTKGKPFQKKPYSLDKNPFKLPKSYATKLKVFYLPKSCDRILLLSDLHIPFHDIRALTLALEYGKEKNVNCIFINGDLLDFYPISRFEKVLKKRSVKEELVAAKEFIGILNKTFPNVPIYMLLGNHDIRLQVYLAVKAPELLDISEFRLEYLLEAQKHGMIVLEDTTLVKMGKLSVTHGHLLIKGIFSPVNSARGAFLRSKASVLISHVHKVSTHSETSINQKTITCYSTGCLCELSPHYNPFGNNYNHGFAYIETKPNGMFKVNNVQIVDGEIVN